MYSQIRIIGGALRGRKINFVGEPTFRGRTPTHSTLRPTPDRVRETLFNWLSHKILDAECLDAFGGSGALSFESVSRGAKQVTLIEQCPMTTQVIKDNITRFNINTVPDPLTVLCAETLSYLATTPKVFDIIFLDPPFEKNKEDPQLLLSSMNLIRERHLLHPEGYLYIESGRALEEYISDDWLCYRSKKAGNVYYGLFTLR